MSQPKLCPYCHEPVTETRIVCPHCGAVLSPESAILLESLHKQGSVAYQKGQFDHALKCWQEGLAKAEAGQNLYAQSVYLNNLGLLHRARGALDKSLDLYQKSIALKEKTGLDSSGLAQVYHNLGLAYKEKGEFAKALDYYQKSIEIKEKQGEILGLAQTLYNMGILEMEKGKLDEAASLLERAMSTFQQLENKEELQPGEDLKQERVIQQRECLQQAAEVSYTLGRQLLKNGHWQKALALQKAAKVAFKQNGQKSNMADACLELGKLYELLNDYEQSRWSYKDALRLYRQLEDKDKMAITQANLAKLELKTGLVHDAITHLEEARQHLAHSRKTKLLNQVNQLLDTARKLTF